MLSATNRIGEILKNNNGTEMKIIAYTNSHNIIVKFLDGHGIETKTSYLNFLRGQVRNPYDRTVFGIGYLGEGEYKTKINGRQTDEYRCWKRMMQRCYDSNYHLQYPSYKDCSVCAEWHNFRSFARWYSQNFYQMKDKIMCLDKDILNKGNKVYSPDNCIFVPNEINCTIINRSRDRGNFPVGVIAHENRYVAQCSSFNGKQKYIGTYDTPKEAFYGYKCYKENVIREIADEYKLLIPDKLYNALINYKIDIND